MNYSNSVLIGNWAEERLKIEFEYKLFLRKRERNELLLQKARILYKNLLAERPLAISGNEVLFGYNAQVVAPDMPAKGKRTSKGTPQYGLALSCLVGNRQVDTIQNVADGCVMTLSPITAPCCRNTFVVESTTGRDSRRGEKLKFGEDFYLRMENYADPQTNTRIIIKSRVADKSLCVMNQNWMQTLFGPECGVTLKDVRNYAKLYTAECVFMLLSDIEKKK